VNRRDLRGALEAARVFAAGRPGDRDAERTVETLESILGEMQRAEEQGADTHTIPMFGHPAALMQLRMGNLAQACVVYRKLIARHPDDDRARLMLADIEALLRAVAGEPVADDELGGDATQMVGYPDDESTLDALPSSDALGIPVTNITQLPDRRSAPERSGPVPVTHVGLPEGMDDQNTTQTPRPDLEAERLAGEGKLAEAESIFRRLARMEPERHEWERRASEVCARRLAAEAREGVLVRAIVSVK